MNILDTLNNEESRLIEQKSFSKGEHLYREGEVCDGVFIVQQGLIKIVSYSLSGEEIIYNELGRGSLFGNNLVFSSDPRFRGNVIAYQEGSLSYIKKKALLTLLEANEKFLIAYLNIQSDFGKSLNEKIKILSFQSAEERLMFYLSQRNGEIRFKSLSSLAESLFLKRETLSRLVHRLEQEGRLVFEGKRIVLKPE